MLASGLDRLARFTAPLQPLSEDAGRGIEAWNFCGGWYPERLPLYCALTGEHDLELLAYLMQVIRDHGKE